MCTSYTSIYISEKKITDCLIYCILSNGEVIKYHKFISVVVIELSARCLNTGPEDRLVLSKYVNISVSSLLSPPIEPSHEKTTLD